MSQANPNAHIAVLIFDGFADWEPAYALSGLRRWGNCSVQSYGYSDRPATSMGGLRVVPDRLLSSMDISSTRLMLLPGGDAWLAAYPTEPVHAMLQFCTSHGIPVAGICAATVALARAGLFVDRLHTSNGAAFLLEHAAAYRDPSLYRNALAVRHRGVISASGLGAVEFAQEIFAELDILNEADRGKYNRMYRQGEMP